jgi:hypothetical protein
MISPSSPPTPLVVGETSRSADIAETPPAVSPSAGELRQTVFSKDRVYRFTLWRSWGQPKELPYGRMGKDGFEPVPIKGAAEFVMFIGLNPSTADESKNDPTIRRCIAFAKRWGYGAMCMTNLFAYRATLPKDMMAFSEPIGMDNGPHLISVARYASVVVACWGKHGRHNDRDANVICLFEMSGLASKISCLSVNTDGTPKHPLYLRADTKLEGFPQ